ncbi:MAG: glycosyltransferase [Sulfuricaulis sp.]
MKVSVLMAVYNGEKFLSEAVNSILQQTHKDLEFVIVNDGSTDSSTQLLQEIRDDRVKVVRQENQGLAAALNRGLAECSCEIVVRMDADDISYPERVEVLLDEWNRHGRPDVYGSCADYINSHGRYLWTFMVPTEHQDIKNQMLAGFGGALIHPSVLFRKQAVLECSGYDPTFRRNGEDFDLWLRMCERYQFGNTTRALIQYRLSEWQVSGKVGKESGTWARLLALQKKQLTDMGMTNIWMKDRNKIEAVLWERFVKSGSMASATVRRTLTELKVMFHSGRFAAVIWNTMKLCLSRPRTLIVTLIARRSKTVDLKDIVLTHNDLMAHGLLPKTQTR